MNEDNPLSTVLAHLLSLSEATGRVTLDQIGEAIGARAVSVADIDKLFTALEGAGRIVTSPEGQGLERKLGLVVVAARALRAEAKGGPIHLATVADRARLPVDEVLAALSLLRVMQR